MERVKFLRDIEDETKYAQGLELAYLEVFNAVHDLSKRMSYESGELDYSDCENPYGEIVLDVRQIEFVMGLVIRDFTDRRKRLADVAAGLSDVVFDEESPEK